ncbi:hypothetical protein HFD88_000313 [Aspergillus terreus]|nr:hypothetical protein HFD88_000313 [Aspergillus terreus]
MDLPRSPSGFRSRRSYPSLNHISLAPLTPRFPIDDDDDVDYPNEPQDYFSPRGEAESAPTYSGYDTPPRTSYLSSFSVPGTPGVLSHSQSRSGSRARNHRHQRSKSTTREKTLSDTNLRDQAAAHPLHHHSHSHQHHHHNAAPRTKSTHSHHRRDTEWMLRTASALASSAREEKGQSWLVKRASSTSLVSEVHANDADSAAAAGGGGSSRACRRSRSGRSTPAAFSRRGSLSRAASRRGSRPELSMTGLEMTGAGAGGKTGMPAEDVRHFVPDFVDERIRAEMEWIRQEEEQEDGEGYTSASSDGYFDSDDDIDEQEFQRLTRERGFGLGSWVDRVVGWTVFGDDDWPWASATAPVESSKTVEERSVTTGEHDDHLSVSSVADDLDRASVSDADRQSVIEKPGETGGWEDAGWLFRTMKRAFF